MMNELTLDDFMVFTEGFRKTCSIENLRDRAVTFVKDKGWLFRLLQAMDGNGKQVISMCESALASEEMPEWFRQRARPMFFSGVEEKFILYHNRVNQNESPKPNNVAASARCHPTVLIGADGMRYYKVPGQDVPLAMIHMGNVVIGDGVEVGPYSTIHRATLDSTVIGPNCKIGSYVNVGHNVVIGGGTCITPYVCIGGSAQIGENCWLGMHTTLRDNIRLCDQVKIGMGSIVVKDITESGLYFGSPAERRGDWDGVWK